MKNKPTTASLESETITYTFKAKKGVRSDKNGQKVRNTLKTYFMQQIGYSEKEIADELKVSIRTVYRYKEEINKVLVWKLHNL